jgi:hypothetical protein
MLNSPLHPLGRPRFRLGPGQRFVGVFALFILLPGAFLAAFALRVLRQEGQVARQRVREGLERASLDIARDLESGFRQWTEALVGAVAGKKPLEIEDFPAPVGQVLSKPGGGAILSVSDGRLEVFPPGAVLYIPPGSSAGRPSSGPLPSGLAAAESLELARKDYAGAARAYRNLLASADAASRPLVLQRLARTLRKAGRAEEAARAYRELLDMERAWIGNLPSDLVARYELCAFAAENGDPGAAGRMALDFYRDLEEGTWPLGPAAGIPRLDPVNSRDSWPRRDANSLCRAPRKPISAIREASLAATETPISPSGTPSRSPRSFSRRRPSDRTGGRIFSLAGEGTSSLSSRRQRGRRSSDRRLPSSPPSP